MTTYSLNPKIYGAARDGDVGQLRLLFRENYPDADVNYAPENYLAQSVLHIACDTGSSPGAIRLLLAHPDIEVNKKDNFGATPFYWACRYGHLDAVRIMLQDSRVRLNEPTMEVLAFATPVREAAANGHLAVVKWMLASKREVFHGGIKDGDPATDPLAAAKLNGWTAVVSLLERYKKDKKQCISEIRNELRLLGTERPSLRTWPFNSSFIIMFL